MVEERADVAIVGAGPTGATLANLLGRRGHRVVVFEQLAEPFPQPRACHLDAETARIIQHCGLAHELRSIVTPSPGMEYVDRDGTHLFTFEGFERQPLLGWQEDYVFYQPDLDDLLRRGLERFAGVTAHYGTPSPPLDELCRAARFVVGADGAASTVRRQLGVSLRDLGYDEPWLVVDVLMDRPPGRGSDPMMIRQVCDPGRLTTYVPSHGRHHRWEFRLVDPHESPDPWDLLRAWGVEPSHAELLRAVPYRFHALLADRWRGGPDGRVLLAGDAAHQMPPFMGQGMCSGLRDAANLAWRLDEVLRGAAGPDHLDAYEAERSTHTRQVIELSIAAGRLLDQITADLVAGRPPHRPEPAVADDWRWSRLPGLDLGAPFPVGHQAPQPMIDGRPLDDHLGDGWAWVAADASFVPPDGRRRVVTCPEATMGARALLVRPDRYVAAAVIP